MFYWVFKNVLGVLVLAKAKREIGFMICAQVFYLRSYERLKMMKVCSYVQGFIRIHTRNRQIIFMATSDMFKLIQWESGRRRSLNFFGFHLLLYVTENVFTVRLDEMLGVTFTSWILESFEMSIILQNEHNVKS